MYSFDRNYAQRIEFQADYIENLHVIELGKNIKALENIGSNWRGINKKE